MSRLALAMALVLLAGLIPDAAGACSVCYGGAEESRKAFLFTTVLLSLLPIGMIGALGWWVWRTARDAESAASDEDSGCARDPSGDSTAAPIA